MTGTGLNEAYEIVLQLARGNLIDARQMPDEHARQELALTLVEQAARLRSTGKDQDRLEHMVDCLGLAGILDALETICYAKADHISANWQDQSLARRWTKAAIVMTHARDRVVKVLP